MDNYRDVDLPPHCGNCVFYDCFNCCQYPRLEEFVVRQFGPDEDPEFVVETILEQNYDTPWPRDCVCDHWQEPGDVLAQKDRAFDEAVDRVKEILARM